MTDTLERLKCLYSAVNNKKELGFYDLETLDRSIAEITVLETCRMNAERKPPLAERKLEYFIKYQIVTFLQSRILLRR